MRKITPEQRDEAKQKIEKYKAKMADALATLKAWEEAEKKEPARDDEELFGYLIDDDSSVTKLSRSRSVEKPKVAKAS